MTDRGTALERALESLARAQEMLAHYRGTPCESDYAEMVARYEQRVSALR